MCTQWKKIRNGVERCATYTIDSDSMSWTHDDGETGTAKIKKGVYSGYD
jgi:hypothetical protein